MKHLSAFFLIFSLLILSGCGGDSNHFTGGDDSGKTTPGGDSGKTTPDDDHGKTSNLNTNANTVGTVKEVTRYEFPHVKGGSMQLVLVKKLSSGEVNYSMEWDCNKKSNRWSCYQMTATNRARNTKRYYAQGAAQYPDDPDIPAQYQSHWSDYFAVTPEGYSRGHLCPSADRLQSAEANKQTFYISNMQPQIYAFNANGTYDGKHYNGLWGAMENWLRTQITTKSPKTDTLYVVKGGTIDRNGDYEVVKNHGHQILVPTYFFAAVVKKSGSQWVSAIGFWMKNEENKANASLSTTVVSIKELEEKTGIDFFCNIPDADETRLENIKNANYWGVK